MLDIVYKNGRFDLAYVYNFGSVRSTVESAFKAGRSDISSEITRAKKIINKDINTTLSGLKLN